MPVLMTAAAMAAAKAAALKGGMIGGQGLSAAGGGGAITGLPGGISGGLASSVTSGGMFGSVNRGNSTGSSRFDSSQIPLFNQQLAQTDQASAQLKALLQALGQQRTNSLRGDLDNQMSAVQGFGQQEIADTNRRYNSRQGNVGQSLGQRGLYNSTVAPGMRALMERERNSALGQATDRQSQMIGGLLGQRASLLDQSLADQNQAIAGVGANDYQLRALLPAQIAQSRVSTEQRRDRRGGWLSGIFGR